MKTCLLATVVALAGLTPGAGMAESKFDPLRRELATEKKAAMAVARVSDVYAKDRRYEEFHASLAKRMGGVPSKEEFTRDHQWVTVLSTRSNLIPGMFKVWGQSSMNLAVGDIVEIKVGKSEAKAYGDLGVILKVVCKMGAADYEDCAKKNALKMVDGEGNEINVISTLP